MNLNSAQQRAVEADDGPTLVLAGAGTGKTRVIVERLAWLIDERGVDARNLLALTFTNKAAKEMKTRVAARLGMDKLSLWVGTFHSFGLFLLRRHMDKLGRSRDFTIFDAQDQVSLMKKLLRQYPSQKNAISPKGALAKISDLKLRLSCEQAGGAENEFCLNLLGQYERELEKTDSVDFDDLLVLPTKLFREHEDVLERYKRRYRYVHIDEYQDTNRAQYLLTKLLTGESGNVFAVGDEDQSIYGWRGADIRNILDFEKDYPDAKVIRLEQNYRCTKHILSAANAVVSNNAGRLGKTLWTENEGDEPVGVYLTKTAEDEAAFVVQEIVDRKLERQETAVLFRTNAQARLVEESLRRKGIAYVVIGGVRFYSRKEVKDLVAYLRLVVNPRDDVSLRRIVNVPTRGIGATTLQTLESYAQERGKPVLETMREVERDENLPSRSRNAIAAFVHLMDDLVMASKSGSVAEFVESLISKIGYEAHLKKEGERESEKRLEVVGEFVSACAQFDEDSGGRLLDFLQELSLQGDTDKWDEEEATVTLITCHSVKGLEFDHVFLLGLEEGLLPHASALGSDYEVEEERRLCYVAMTRARKTLILSAAQERMLHGERRSNRLSRFLAEMAGAPKEAVKRLDSGDKPRKNATMVPAAPPRVESGLKRGVRVRHSRFGNGVVVMSSGTGKSQKVRIRFQSGRSRMFLLHATPLEILEDKRR